MRFGFHISDSGTETVAIPVKTVDLPFTKTTHEIGSEPWALYWIDVLRSLIRSMQDENLEEFMGVQYNSYLHRYAFELYDSIVQRGIAFSLETRRECSLQRVVNEILNQILYIIHILEMPNYRILYGRKIYRYRFNVSELKVYSLETCLFLSRNMPDS